MRIDEQEELAELAAGTELDRRFRVRSLLGEGGMGCVYLAEDLERGHDVALKILIPRYRGRREREQRLLNEAEFAHRVGEHSGMPRLFGSGRLQDLGGCPFVAWEVVQGRDLNAVLTLRYVLPPRLAAQWARQLADALCAMHRAGVVHRDITVTNVFIERPDADARVKLIDLSHAAFVPEVGMSSRRLTRDIEIPGALGFMSPEQTLARPPHPKMDVFSFGVVLHEMLTGTNPFEHVRDRDTYIEMQRAGKLHVPRIDRRVHPNVPEALIDLVEGCTRNDLAQRLDMVEVRRRLDDVLGRMSSPVRLVTSEPASAPVEAPQAPVEAPQAPVEAPQAPVEASAAVIGTAPTETAKPLRARLSSRHAVVVVALAIALVTAVLFALLWRSGDGVEAPGSPEPTPAVEPEAGEASATLPRAEPMPAMPAMPMPMKPAEDETAATSEPEPAKQVEPKAEPLGVDTKSKVVKAAKPPAHETEPCRRIVAEALGADETQAWNRLESLTRKRKCFADGNQWARLRVYALSETGRFAECAALGDKSKDPVVRQYAKICRAQETNSP